MKIKGITIHKNKTCSTWYTRFRQDGKQIYISAKTQKECYNLLKEKLNIVKKDKQSKTYTLLSWYNKWLELFKQNLRNSTIRDYKNLFNLIDIKIKNKKLNKIERIELQENFNHITGERQKQKLYVFLNSILNKAVEFKMLEDNPLKYVKKPEHKKQIGKALNETEQHKLEIKAIEKEEDSILICLYTGLRKGELLAITGNDIDLEKRKLNINKSIDDKNNFSKTKNDYSIRLVPIFDKALEILKKYKNYGNKRIFNFSNTTMQRKFKAVLELAEIDTTHKIHDLRHTFVTNCKNKNIPEHIIQSWIGHNIGSNITSSIYTHVIDDKEQIEIINKFYSDSTQKKDD